MKKTILAVTWVTLSLLGMSATPAMAQTDDLPQPFTGTITDERGKPVEGVIVSNGFTCVQTDAKGQYELPFHSASKFVYFTVSADCEQKAWRWADSLSICASHSCMELSASLYSKFTCPVLVQRMSSLRQ